eukprot:CAMPEP_0119004466 /NCGR_PEP_ID=MMETSP1176-20130426/1156_1 /TAXON_ID=265551 /ORGANISM="Synedropsis recta cf, Strain CCMP1620" /LENGTH=602 /DNA_ID=CAMNT_0006956169 /DNA_START=166 /DNA_END=1971 /DNA_ORIENTATION=-
MMISSRRPLLLLIVCWTLLLSLTNAQRPVFELHGSGAAAPCVSLLMDLLMDRSASPLRLTYRTIDNATAAQSEYRDSVVNGAAGVIGNAGGVIDNDDSSTAASTTTTATARAINVDFGAGHSPLNKYYFDELKSMNKQVLHFPHVLSAVGLYHSIADFGTTDNGSRLNLTACLMAQIFSRNITSWKDAAILKENPLLATTMNDNADIVVVRANGASPVTQGLTQYLRLSCPAHWSADRVGDTIDWPTGVVNCATDMTTCLNQHTNAIGFSHVLISPGTGSLTAASAFNNIQEVPLPNKEGRYHTSQQAQQLGGLEAAITVGGDDTSTIPTSAQDSFAAVNLIYQSGPDTWPIVLMNYVYVAADFSHIHNPKGQGLLLAFLQALYELPYVYHCQTLLDLTPVPAHVRDLGLQGIQQLKDSHPNAQPWEWERVGDDDQYYPAGDFVLSERRQSFAHQQLFQLSSDVAVLKSKESAGSQSGGSGDASGGGGGGASSDETTNAAITALKDQVTTLQGDNDALHTLVTSLLNRVVQLETNGAVGPSPTPNNANFNLQPIDISVLDDDTAIAAASALPQYDENAESQLQSALTLASMSFTFWAIYFVW